MSISTFIAQQTSTNTRRAYANDLARWASFLGGREATPEVVVDFKRELERTLAPASAARTFAACRSYYRWLGGPNPFDRVKAPQRVLNQTPKVPKDTAVDQLLAVVDTSDLPGLRHRAIITLLTNGLRAQEVADLRRESLTFEPEYEAWVLRVFGKGQKERLVPALPEAVEAVQAYQRKAKHVTPWLLADYDGSKLTYKQVEYAVYKWADVAGLDDMHPHALRHHYATRLVRAGVHLLALQKLLGHARADTTQLYVTLDLSDIVAAAKLDPRAQTEQPRPQLVAVGA